MTRRESWVVAVLCMVTCGFYYFYWQYVTTDELKQVTKRDDINPVLDLIITIALCGLWGIYVQYRNTQVVHQTLQAQGRPHEDKSTIVLILHLLTAFNGITSIIAVAIVQDELNKLVDMSNVAPAPIAY